MLPKKIISLVKKFIVQYEKIILLKQLNSQIIAVCHSSVLTEIVQSMSSTVVPKVQSADLLESVKQFQGVCKRNFRYTISLLTIKKAI